MSTSNSDPVPELEDAGIPGFDHGATDPLAMDVGHDRPLAAESWGTTAAEQRAGEPLDLRLAHEEPDIGEAYPVEPDGGVGRLVEPDEGAHEDTESDAVARDVGTDGGGMSAEELAVHLSDRP
jgi:hypothetical protein